MGQTKVTRK